MEISLIMSEISHVPMSATLVDFMGTDITVVNAARVSFGKRKRKLVSENDSYEDVTNRPNDVTNHIGDVKYGFELENTAKIFKIEDDDVKLIKYLAKHNHWSPFGHCSLQFHIKAPFFVVRQLGKHQVGLVWNEVSRRYVDAEPEFYMPDNMRLRAENKKQGSSKETTGITLISTRVCLDEYKHLLSMGVAPEEARMVLPMNTMTEFYWSGTLYAFARVCNLRLAKDTQQETRLIAKMISDKCRKLFPVSWASLVSSELEDSVEI
jgi:thymidylate synthase (FAD)